MHIKPTPLGKFFLLLMALFYAASITSQSGLLILLIGLFAGMVGLNLIVAWRTLRGLEVEAPKEIFLAEGEAMTQPWRVRNHSSAPAKLLQLTSTVGTLLRISRIGGGATCSKIPALKFAQRGIHPNDSVRVSCIAPFGFVQVSKSFNLSGRVVVYPAIYLVDAPAASGLDTMSGGKFRGGRRSSSGSSFAGVRPLIAGDPLKQIHWKTSAKRSQLMVKTFDEELSGRVAVLLDCDGADNTALAENAIRAAGSLAFAAAEAGHFVELVEVGAGEKLLLQPFSDGTEALLRLAGIVLQAVPSSASALTDAIQKISSKAAIAYVGTAHCQIKMDLLEKVARKGRNVSTYLPEQTVFPAPTPGVSSHFFGEKKITGHRSVWKDQYVPA